MKLSLVNDFTISRVSKAYRKKELSPVELIEFLLERIERENNQSNAFITVCNETALRQAKTAELEIANGKIKSPLHGIPIAVKDLIYSKGIRTTMGSGAFKHFIPKYDATVIRKLHNKGAIIIGKTNTHELAYGPTGDDSFYGPVRNPYNESKMAGGSSSGSAAAVANNLTLGALGTDTGGSVRIPASFCGIVGMKPTLGSISNYGVQPLSFTMDHIGPLTKNIKDNAILLKHLVGKDANDPNSKTRKQEDFTSKIGKNVNGTVAGIPFKFFENDSEEEILTSIDKLVTVLEDLGIHVKNIKLPFMDKLLKSSQVTAHSEVYTNYVELAKKENSGIGEHTRKRILQGAGYTATEYIQAQRDKQQFIREFELLFDEIDFLITPASPILPQDIGKRQVTVNGREVPIMSVLTKFALPFNFLGLPSLVIPWEMSKNGLPMGVQIVGGFEDESRLYGLGHLLENNRS